MVGYAGGVATRDVPLPPLTALRTFEVAARLLSFTRAAAELGVTQTAVSHQVKLLEEHLGVPLFRRMPRRLALTNEGQAWSRELGEVFSRLREACRKLRARVRDDRPVVAVSVLPSFAARWLVPRLGRFLERHPGIDVRISASEEVTDFATEAIDVALRFGRGKYPGLVSHKLADDALVVVCAPAMKAKKRLHSPSDLRRCVLLHDDNAEQWPTWLAEHRVADVDAGRGLTVTDSSMLVEAAVRGQGVALARWSLAAAEVDAGRLVVAFPDVPPLPTRRSYWVVGPRENLSRPPVATFVEWVRAEAKTKRPS